MALFVKLLVTLPDHPKFIAAGGAACWLWYCGLARARAGETDGFLPRAVVAGLVPGQGAAATYKQAARLVEVGLWEQVDNGYQIHDYLDGDFNPSKAALEEKRTADRERQRAWRDRRAGDDLSQRDNTSVTHRVTTHAGTGAGDHSPSHSDSPVALDRREESARETHRPTRPTPGARQLGVSGTHHNCPPGTWAACGRGVCVPPFVAQEWQKAAASAGLDPRAEAEATVAQLLARYPHGQVIAAADPAKLWRSAWAERHGDATPTPRRQPAPIAETIGHDWQAECAKHHAGRCGNPGFHAAKMAEEAEVAAS